MSDDAASLIDKLGGYAKVAAGIDVPAGTVAAWRHRRSIPVGYWSALVAFAVSVDAEGVTYEGLGRAHASPHAEIREPAPASAGAAA